MWEARTKLLLKIPKESKNVAQNWRNEKPLTNWTKIAKKNNFKTKM